MYTLLVLYVDDILLTGNDQQGIDETISHLESRFISRNLGYAKCFINIKIQQLTNNHILVHQEQYVSDILHQFSVQNAHPVKTSMISVHNHKLKLYDVEKVFPYKQALGCLQYLANYTRLDIAFALGYLATFQSNPQPIHWTSVKRIFRYLQGYPKKWYKTRL